MTLRSYRRGVANPPQSAAEFAAQAATGVPKGAVIWWMGAINDIPAGFVICDGNNGTLNLIARLPKGVATAATDPGTTSTVASGAGVATIELVPLMKI